jgi:hypothetical protein
MLPQDALDPDLSGLPRWADDRPWLGWALYALMVAAVVVGLIGQFLMGW